MGSAIPCVEHVAARTNAGIRRCAAATEAGRPCPQHTEHITPACPSCGRSPWHEQAVCAEGKPRHGCGYDARTGVKPQRKGH